MSATTRTLTIRVPMDPPPEVMPNARVHWRVKAQATKAFREAAYLAGYQVWEADLVWDFPILRGLIRVRATIGWGKGRRCCDPDNAAAALKAVWDGLTYAAIWEDDRALIHEPVRQERDPEGMGYVVLEITEEEA